MRTLFKTYIPHLVIALGLAFFGVDGYAWAQQQVQVFMQVGDTPATPGLVESIDPATEPVLVNFNGSRSINFTVNPNVTNNPLSWIVTVDSGAPLVGGIVGPVSGTIDTTNTTRGYFDFLSPVVPGPSRVTLRVFDSTNVVAPVFTRTISLYSF